MNEQVNCSYFVDTKLYIGLVEGERVKELYGWQHGFDSSLEEVQEVKVLVTEYANGKVTRHIIKDNEIIDIEIY